MNYTIRLKRLSGGEPLYFTVLSATAEEAVKEALRTYPGALIISAELVE